MEPVVDALCTLEPLDGANYVRPPASLVATRQLAGMLLHSHAACTATKKRKRDGNEHRRQDVAQRTFKVRKDDWNSITLERCVFLVEELKADAASEAVLGVRLWKTNRKMLVAQSERCHAWLRPHENHAR